MGADLDTIFSLQNFSILIGDFNAKHTSWGCTRCDTRGRKLYSYIINNNIDLYAPPTPTRYGTASASTIDYALVKNLNWPCTIESIPELSSDHNPINLHFPRTTQFQLPHLNSPLPGKFRSILSNPNNFYLPDANSSDEVDTK
ncbi:RNA-directed DNA polymerase from mobile element jockey [Trichonephila clavata]|uniref:RNA-directed DNA polymerase from mobile element jockey n=1 Tax=Trichonephila clavata TaxID=2740835 RepID=A0A8X6LPH0_TRICU|nr:RNA-directed DNA polymerase from mobile element jockey [Trichonephila clavata]